MEWFYQFLSIDFSTIFISSFIFTLIAIALVVIFLFAIIKAHDKQIQRIAKVKSFIFDN